MSLHSVVAAVQVGRDAELNLLESFATRRVTTLIAGEAGVGKSRMAGEVVRIAGKRGMMPLAGHCTAEGRIPYAPFATAMRRRTRMMESEELTSLFSGTALLAAALLPEVARVVGLPSDAPDQQELFAAVWKLLSRIAGESGCVLLLEDLHWADNDSMRLLAYLARESQDLPVWMVGTYRIDELHRRHPLTLTLSELGRDHLYEEIRLTALTREQVRTLVSVIFGGIEVSDDLVDALVQRTGGNPFFIEELLKVFLDRGDIYLENGGWERREIAEMVMPESVRATLLTRLRELDDDSLDVLRLAAIAGERLDLAVLAHASAGSRKVDDVLREGLQLQLLVEQRDEARLRYSFRHALTREALADELVGPDRQLAHARVAEALRVVYEDDLDLVPAQLADHYAEASEVKMAIEFGLRAARLAVASFALEEAGRLYERSLRLLDASSDKRLPILLEAGAALIESPDRRLAVAFATQARAIARQQSDQMGEVHAIDVLESDAWSSGDTPRAVALMKEQRELVRGLDPVEEAWVVARLARMLVLADEPDEAALTVSEGIELATHAQNHRALSSLYSSRLMRMPLGSEFDRNVDLAIASARIARNEQIENNLLVNIGYITLWNGHLAKSQESLRRGAEWNRANLPSNRYAEAGLAWASSLAGEYDEAWRLAWPLRAHGHVPTRIVALGALCEVAERRGDPAFDELTEELRSIGLDSGESQRSVPVLSVVARNRLATEELAVVMPRFWEILDFTATFYGLGSHWMFSPDLASALATTDQHDELRRWWNAIEELTTNDGNDHNLAACELVRAHGLAVNGEAGRARETFNLAAARYREIPCPAREAECFLGLADFEWNAGRPELCADAARRAHDIAMAFGIDALVLRARVLLDRSVAPSVLVTVLFTDIVSSTEQLGQVGDLAWNTRLERHYAVVRRELARYSGREVNTTGDGFLATFATPANAIRCALSIRDAVKSSGLDIRAGLHTGECQVMGDDVTGLAVHIAARVSSLAGPGQVLVSSTVHDLVAGSRFSFDDAGVHALKGVPGEWRLFMAVPSDPC